MKKQPYFLYFVFTLAFALAWTVTAMASQRSPSDSNQQTLIELERGWNDARPRRTPRGGRRRSNRTPWRRWNSIGRSRYTPMTRR